MAKKAMVNTVVLAGVIKSITESPSRQPNKPASAVALLQYGEQRERTGNQVEFINAALIRIPGFRFDKIKARLKKGVEVSVVGHIQGVMKSVMNDGFLTVELVADRVTFADDDGASEEETGAQE